MRSEFSLYCMTSCGANMDRTLCIKPTRSSVHVLFCTLMHQNPQIKHERTILHVDGEMTHRFVLTYRREPIFRSGSENDNVGLGLGGQHSTKQCCLCLPLCLPLCPHCGSLLLFGSHGARAQQNAPSVVFPAGEGDLVLS